MAVLCDPARLHAELIAAGIAAAAFSGCRSGGPLPTVVWATGHPTPAEDATVRSVLAAHDPDGAAKDTTAERQRVRDLETIMDAATTPMAQWRAAVAEHAKIVARRAGASQ